VRRSAPERVGRSKLYVTKSEMLENVSSVNDGGDSSKSQKEMQGYETQPRICCLEDGRGSLVRERSYTLLVLRHLVVVRMIARSGGYRDLCHCHSGLGEQRQTPFSFCSVAGNYWRLLEPV